MFGTLNKILLAAPIVVVGSILATAIPAHATSQVGLAASDVTVTAINAISEDGNSGLSATPAGGLLKLAGVISGYPNISCAFGKVKLGKCYCPHDRVKVHAGYNAWRCVKRTARPGSFKTTPAARSKARKQNRRRAGAVRARNRRSIR